MQFLMQQKPSIFVQCLCYFSPEVMTNDNNKNLFKLELHVS